MVRCFTRLRGRMLVALATILVLSVAAPASAGFFEVPDEKSGTYGKREFPAGECVYESNKGPDILKAIKVGPPKLFWPNKPGVGSQGKVGYRIELMDNGQLLRRSKLFSGTATRTTSPTFIKRSMAVTPASGHTYNVYITAVWFRPDGTKLGTVRHFVAYYEGSTAQYMTWCTEYA